MKKIVALVLCLALALSLATVAFAKAGDTIKLEGTYYSQTTDEELGTGTEITGGIKFTSAKAPKTKDGSTTPGNIAYYTIDSTDYVKVAALKDADLVVCKTADMTKNHFLYLAKVDAVGYVNAKKFTNFGDKCGQFNDEPEDGVNYYLYEVNGYEYVAAADDEGKAIVMVNGKVVKVATGADYVTVKHDAVPTIDEKTGKTTGYTCSACKAVAVNAGNVAAIPDDAEAIVGTTWYFPVKATGSGNVESAETFDAGIAVYAGMALASVAGSAVVIGKKKEF